MSEEELFKLFHKYNKLVRRQLIQPLKCSSCGFPYITALGGNDELVLECTVCETQTTPGLATIGNVRAVVKEHFLE
jgi:ribosomal protein L44E